MDRIVGHSLITEGIMKGTPLVEGSERKTHQLKITKGRGGIVSYEYNK